MLGKTTKLMAMALAAVVATAGCEAGDDAADQDATQAPPAQQPQQPQQQDQQQVGQVPEGATAEQVEQGRQLFTGQGGCVACHGPQATGTQLAPDLTDGEWLNVEDPSMESVATLIRTGVSDPVEHPAPMPAMGGANLNDEQVEALAAYVLSIAQS